MVRKLKVPDRHKEAVLAILHLGGEKRSQILADLEKLDHPPRPSEIASLLRRQVPEMSEQMAEDVTSFERALAKHENLSDILTDFGMECLDLEEDE